MEMILQIYDIIQVEIMVKTLCDLMKISCCGCMGII